MDRESQSNDINYDINDLDIKKAREVTVKCNGKRFRIFLEIVTSCFGNCQGCSLSFIDKKNFSAAISIERIQEILSYFVPIIENKKELRTTVVNLGTGDYFMMDEEFLEKLFKSIRVFFDHLPTVRNVLTVSTSLSLPEEKMLSRLEIMTRHLHKSQFAVEAVIDPMRLSRDYDRYLTNLRGLTKHLPFFDVVLNISQSLQPEHAPLVAQFLKDSNALNFDIQYAINNTNSYRVKAEQANFNQFIANLYASLGQQAKEIFDLSISIPNHNSEDSIDEVIQSHAHNIIKERLSVNAQGDIYPIAFGYGDILLDHRYDFPALGNISTPFDEQEAQRTVADYLKKILLKNKYCYSCEHLKKCYSTGYSFYNKFNDQPGQCQNIGRPVFERFANSL